MRGTNLAYVVISYFFPFTSLRVSIQLTTGIDVLLSVHKYAQRLKYGFREFLFSSL